MARLIKEDDVIKIIDEELKLRCGYDSDIALLSVKRNVAKLPTAYDVDKVVEELEDVKNDCGFIRSTTEASSYCKALNKAIGIVRKGGVEW